MQSLIERGRYADALRLATAADRRAKASGDLALEAHVELARGTIWQARGFPRPAVQHFEHALDAARRADQRALVAAAYGSLASAHGDLGHWDRVLDFAERRHEAEPRQTSDSEFRYRFQRGVAYAEFHDRERAEANLVEALSIARKANDRRSTSMALGELASAIADFQHDTPRALSLYDEALGIAKDAGVRDLEATWLLDSGAALREAGRYAEAGARFTRAIDAERASGARRVTPAAQKNLAQVFLHDDDRRAAAATLAAAERGADDQNLGELRWQVRVERAVMARDDGRAAEAERLFDEALDILEDAQGSVLVEQLRSGALQHALASADPYDLFIAFLLSHGNASKAFFVAERGRARAFLDTLRTAGDQIAQALPPEYAEAEATLLADISEGQAALRGERLPVADRRSLQAAIRSDEEQLAALRLRLASDRPAVSAVRYPRLWQAADLGATVLKPNQALIAFFLGATTSNAWIVHAKGTQVVTLPAQATIETAVRAYLKSVGGAGEPDSAATLYRLLLQDAHVPPGVDTLAVIPHGILFDLPLEALRGPDGVRVIERYDIQYAPSASSFALLASRGAGARRTPSVLAVGNPLVTGSKGAPTRDVGVEHLSLLRPLPFTGTELRAIAEVYGPAARILEGAGATERALRDADLSALTILHFATHGLIDESHPERSGLVLTALPPADDGVLQVREVYGLRLHEALVTLSACETALGTNVRGEGMIGLSRAFFYAGADLVVASLWNVNDRSTATLMTRFYEGLGRGEPAAAALRHAKLTFLQGPQKMRDPYYWAPFIAIGNGDWANAPVPPRPRRLQRAWLLALGAAAIALVIVSARRRRRTSRTRW
ncbi:MAG TPA: CHAT domain-containing protein [Vicinamibacterales bacterium]